MHGPYQHTHPVEAWDCQLSEALDPRILPEHFHGNSKVEHEKKVNQYRPLIPLCSAWMRTGAPPSQDGHNGCQGIPTKQPPQPPPAHRHGRRQEIAPSTAVRHPVSKGTGQPCETHAATHAKRLPCTVSSKGKHGAGACEGGGSPSKGRHQQNGHAPSEEGGYPPPSSPSNV